MTRKAIITGISGQDGQYLTEFLLAKDYSLLGLSRHPGRASTSLNHVPTDKLEICAWDPCNQQQVSELIEDFQPDEIYNLAAYTSGAGMFDKPVEQGEVNALSVTRILESVRNSSNDIHFCQASSREVFGAPTETPQYESTIKIPRSPYGAAKLYADNMVKLYRDKYGMFCCSAILYNHESPRRPLNFVSRKICHEAARIKLGMSNQLVLGDLDAVRDWGFAGDFVQGMWKMLHHDCADDYILATGKAHSVRDLCEAAFSFLDLDYREYVHQNPVSFRSNEPAALVGCADKAEKELHWETSMEFSGLIQMMVQKDLELLSN